jgi:hypothetical protein
VNADYLEATTIGLARGKRSGKTQAEEFKGFDYINPTVFQVHSLTSLPLILI